ncbi:MAG: RNA polymerase sigma factor [bacterium]
MKKDWQRFLQLWQEYQPLCLTLLRRYRGESREDVASELKIIFFQLLTEYDPSANIPLPGYLKAKLALRLYNHLRKVWLRKEKECLPGTMPERSTASDKENPEKQVSIELAHLTDQQRKVIKLIYFHGYSERETARALKVSPSRIHKVKEIALKKLRGEQP